MLYCSLDLSLRSGAGKFAQTYSAITEEVVNKRLSSSIYWLKIILKEVFSFDNNHIDGDLRFIAVDELTVREPDAKQTSFWRHRLLITGFL